MEPKSVNTNSHPYKKAKLSCHGRGHCGARRGLLTSSLRLEAGQKQNNEQQTARPSFVEDVVGSTDTEGIQFDILLAKTVKGPEPPIPGNLH